MDKTADYVFLSIVCGIFFINTLIIGISMIESFTRSGCHCSFEIIEPKDLTIGCYDLNFTETAKCLYRFTQDNFHYNITEDSINLTLEEFMERGGDCYDYAKFYVKSFIERGFKAEIKEIDLNESDNISHTFTIAYGDSSYCTIDIGGIACFTLV